MNQPTVFISYGHEDAAAARQLHADLVAAGFHPWMDESNLLPGQRWREAIKSAIEESRFFIALLSTRTVDRRGFVHRELVNALEVLDTYPEHDIYLIPARLDDCTPTHRKLRDLHWVDLFPRWDSGVRRITEAIREAAQHCAVSATPPDLSVDDVIVTKQREHILLDVRVRNTGTSVVNITRADLHVLKRVPYAAIDRPSASYDLLLAGEHNVIGVAHVLRSNEVDRFTIRVGFTAFNTSCGFEAQLILHYNGDAQAVSPMFSFSSTFE